MKVLCIYDPHGQSNLIPTEQEIEEVDKVVFGGDYFDSFTIHPSTQYRMMQKMLDIKKKYGNKIALLPGNHDNQYMFDGQVGRLKCSGFNDDYFVRFNVLLKHHKDLFQNAWQYKNHLFTHAGVVTQLIDAIQKKHPLAYQDVQAGFIQLADILNGTQMEELYYVGSDNQGGHDSYSGIFWARPWSLDENQPAGYIQHVGHTNVEFIDDKYLNSNTLHYYDGLGKITIKI